MSAAAAKVRRFFTSPEKISDLGHEAWRVTEGLQRQCALLDSQPLTVGAFLRGDVKAPDIGGAEQLLAEVERVLEGGDATFELMSAPHSLSSWRDQLSGAIEYARQFKKGAT